jgi:squalene-associated FAD-dependent desaturase
MAAAVVTGYDVAVVGGGFAGLSAAVRLAGGGARVLVLEARGRLGGRATAFPDRETGEIVDNGQHVLLGCYTETFAFLGAIGAADFVRAQPQLKVTMIDGEGRRSSLECPALPAPFHLVAGVLDWSALTWADRFSILRMAGPLAIARRQLAPGATAIAASASETVENWLIRNGQTPRLREMLWEPLALAALNQPAAHAAAPVFARVLAEMFGAGRKSSAIVLPVKPLDQMYAEPARAFIERRGGAVRTGSPATIRIESGAVTSVASGAERWSVPAAIAAVPWHALNGVCDGETAPLDATLARARAMTSSPIVTVNLWFDRPLFDEPFLGLPGRHMQWVFDKRSAGLTHLSLVSSGAAPLLDRPNPEIIAAAREELAGALPEARSAQLLRATVVREPRATFSLAAGEPARPATATAVAGLCLAGDWIDTGLPATIESAVRSGHRAAAALSDQP